MDPRRSVRSSLLEQSLKLIEENYVQEVSREALLHGGADAVKLRLEEMKAPSEVVKLWSAPEGAATKSAGVMARRLKILARDTRYGLTEQEWTYVALQGFAKALGDKYCKAMDPESYFLFQQSLKQRDYYGVGLSLGLRESSLIVVDVLPGSPAERAEIRKEDVLLELDGLSVKQRSVAEVEAYLEGEEGTKVELLVSRKGEARRLVLTRRALKSRSVSSEFVELEGGGTVCWIRMGSMSEDSASELSTTMEGLQSATLLGCVLDLRGNAGGYLKPTLQVASLFLDSGKTIVVTRQRNKSDTRQTVSVGSSALPLFVLVDEGTASSAEILTGALQDHGRAQVFGVTTYGKGSVQTLLELSDGGALKVTTSLYETPKGRRFDRQGLVPDRTVSDWNTAREFVLKECASQWKVAK